MIDRNRQILVKLITARYNISLTLNLNIFRFLIMQQTNPVQFYFEVVEHNEFKRLIHLSLKTGPATDADIKKHMSDTIMTMKV